MGTKTVSAKRPLLKKSLFLSLLIHTALVSLLVWGFWDIIERPTGSGESFIAVSLVGSDQPVIASPSLSRAKQSPVLDGEIASSPQEEGLLAMTSTEGGEIGCSLTLQQIRSKIERAKYYPLIARRQNIEGAPVVEFKIANNGGIEYVRLAQTSGSALLDEAAQETVKKAGPLPFYPKPISLSLDYALSGR
ncbi:MAG: energy transducer TonB [Deltaproteobacteria bacterium]|nr:energy transducer TonB [Deltaproteobacteria bacterium]